MSRQVILPRAKNADESRLFFLGSNPRRAFRFERMVQGQEIAGHSAAFGLLHDDA